MKIRFTKINPKAHAPERAHPTDAGWDLKAVSYEYVEGGKVKYRFGIGVELPAGHVGLIFPRSSVYKTSLRLTNCVGVVDSGYRGEISAIFDAVGGSTPDDYVARDKVCQMIVLPYPEVEWEEASELSVADRGENGYGSSGR